MNFLGLTVLFFLVVISLATPVPEEPRHYDIAKAPELFEKFVKDFDRHYKDAEDREAHYNAFVNSLHIINKSNEASPLTTFGINNFADYTEEEQKKMDGVITFGDHETYLPNKYLI